MERSDFLAQWSHVKEPSLSMQHAANELGVSALEADVAEFLLFFLKGLKKKHVVEVGTGVGYSAMLFRKIFPQASIVTIDRVEKRQDKAKEFLAENIRFILSEGTACLTEFTEPIDLLFLDGAKAQYLSMLKAAEKNFTEDILIIADNIFARGKSYEVVNHRFRTLQNRMKSFLDYVDTNYEMVILNIGDGLLLARKRGTGWNY
ncbi:O-methyltransferase [Guggenheimella bovis]